jgi:hypothetical protein
MKSFIDSVVELGKSCQIITAITLNSEELIKIISEIKAQDYHKISIEGKAFKRFF